MTYTANRINICSKQHVNESIPSASDDDVEMYNPAQETRFGGKEAQNSGVLAQQANAAIAGQTFHPIQTNSAIRKRSSDVTYSLHNSQMTYSFGPDADHVGVLPGQDATRPAPHTFSGRVLSKL